MLKQVTPRVLSVQRVAWAAAMLGFLSGNIAQGAAVRSSCTAPDSGSGDSAGLACHAE